MGVERLVFVLFLVEQWYRKSAGKGIKTFVQILLFRIGIKRGKIYRRVSSIIENRYKVSCYLLLEFSSVAEILLCLYCVKYIHQDIKHVNLKTHMNIHFCQCDSYFFP